MQNFKTKTKTHTVENKIKTQIETLSIKIKTLGLKTKTFKIQSRDQDPSLENSKPASTGTTGTTTALFSSHQLPVLITPHFLDIT